jgi:hypothetical protein
MILSAFSVPWQQSKQKYVVEETKEKKERKIVNSSEVHHICVETRHKETH